MLPATSSASMEEFKRNTDAKLRGIRCPQHHQAPVVRFHGTTLRDVTIRMSACCDQLMELANRAIAEPAK